MGQSVILYGSDMWVTTMRIGRVLGGFHHRVARRQMGRQPQIKWDSLWFYHPLEHVMVEAGFQNMNTYVSRRYNTVAQFILTRPIMELCLAAERRPGSRVANQWCDQDRLDLEGMRTAAR